MRFITQFGMVGLLVILAGGMCGCPPRTQTSGLLSRLEEMKLEPHPNQGRYVEAGAVYVQGDLKNPYPPTKAFVNAEELKAEPTPAVAKDLNYTDTINSTITASVRLLEFLGLSGSLDWTRVSYLKSTGHNLLVSAVRTNVLAKAALRPDFLNQLDASHSLLVADTVGRIERLTLNFYDQRQAKVNVTVPDDMVPLSGRAERTVKEENEEVFEQFVVGSAFQFRAGGAGSSVSEATAKQLLQTLKDSGSPDARLIAPNLVVGSVTWRQGVAMMKHAMSLVSLDQTQISLASSTEKLKEQSGRLAKAQDQVGQLQNSVTGLTADRDKQSQLVARLTLERDTERAAAAQARTQIAALTAERDGLRKVSDKVREQEQLIAQLRGKLDGAIGKFNRDSYDKSAVLLDLREMRASTEGRKER
jgi:hypothetical protein